MKRIVTLDFLRGIAILLMTIFHTWLNVFDTSIIDNMDLSQANVIILFFGGLFFIMGHFRSLFLLLSAIIHQYSLFKTYFIKKHPPMKILRRNLLVGFMIYVVGLIREGIFNPWGILYYWIVGDGWTWSHLTQVYLFETIQMIGMGLIFLTLVDFILMKTHWIEKIVRVNLIFAVIGLVFVFASPAVHSAVNTHLGFELSAPGAWDSQLNTTRDYFTRFFWVIIGACDEPIFPFLGQVCAGAMVGTFLAQPDPTKRGLLAIQLGAVALIGLGVVVWGVGYGFEFNFWFHIHPTWYFLMNLGIQLLIITIFLRNHEFNVKSNMEHYLQRTRVFRRWGIISLTIYMYQLFDIFPRMLMTTITGLDFTNRNQMNLGWTVVMMILVLVLFDLSIRLWEKIKFVGTWEWLLIKLQTGFRKAKTNQESDTKTPKQGGSGSRIDPSEVIYHVDPIVFHSVRDRMMNVDFTVSP